MGSGLLDPDARTRSAQESRLRRAIEDAANWWPARPQQVARIRKRLAKVLADDIGKELKLRRYDQIDLQLRAACEVVEAIRFGLNDRNAESLAAAASILSSVLRDARRRECLRKGDAVAHASDSAYAKETTRFFRGGAATVPFVVVDPAGRGPSFTVELHAIRLHQNDLAYVDEVCTSKKPHPSVSLWVAGAEWDTPPSLEAMGLGRLVPASEAWLVLLVDVPAAVQGFHISGGSYGLAAALAIDCVRNRARLRRGVAVGGVLGPDGDAVGGVVPDSDKKIVDKKARAASREGFDTLVYALPDLSVDLEANRVVAPVQTLEQARAFLIYPRRRVAAALGGAAIMLLIVVVVVLEWRGRALQGQLVVERDVRTRAVYNDCATRENPETAKCRRALESLLDPAANAPVDWRLEASAIGSATWVPVHLGSLPPDLRIQNVPILARPGLAVFGRRLRELGQGMQLDVPFPGATGLDDIISIVVIRDRDAQPIEEFVVPRELKQGGVVFALAETKDGVVTAQAMQQAGGPPVHYFLVFRSGQIEIERHPLPIEGSSLYPGGNNTGIFWSASREQPNANVFTSRGLLVDLPVRSARSVSRFDDTLLFAPDGGGSVAGRSVVRAKEGLRVWQLGGRMGAWSCQLVSSKRAICFTPQGRAELLEDSGDGIRQIDAVNLFPNNNSTWFRPEIVWQGSAGVAHALMSFGVPDETYPRRGFSVRDVASHLYGAGWSPPECKDSSTVYHAFGISCESAFWGTMTDAPESLQIPDGGSGGVIPLGRERAVAFDVHSLAVYKLNHPRPLIERVAPVDRPYPEPFDASDVLATPDGRTVWSIDPQGTVSIFTDQYLDRGVATHGIGTYAPTVSPDGTSVMLTGETSATGEKTFELRLVGDRVVRLDYDLGEECSFRIGTSWTPANVDLLYETGREEQVAGATWWRLGRSGSTAVNAWTVPTKASERAIAIFGDVVVGIRLLDDTECSGTGRRNTGIAAKRCSAWEAVGWKLGSLDEVRLSLDACRIEASGADLLRFLNPVVASSGDGQAAFYGVKGCGWLQRGSGWERVTGDGLGGYGVDDPNEGGCRRRTQTQTGVLTSDGSKLVLVGRGGNGIFWSRPPLIKRWVDAQILGLVDSEFFPATVWSEGASWGGSGVRAIALGDPLGQSLLAFSGATAPSVTQIVLPDSTAGGIRRWLVDRNGHSTNGRTWTMTFAGTPQPLQNGP